MMSQLPRHHGYRFPPEVILGVACHFSHFSRTASLMSAETLVCRAFDSCIEFVFCLRSVVAITMYDHCVGSP